MITVTAKYSIITKKQVDLIQLEKTETNTRKELCKKLGVNEVTFRTYIKKGLLPLSIKLALVAIKHDLKEDDI